jgi:hypothetical protein
VVKSPERMTFHFAGAPPQGPDVEFWRDWVAARAALRPWALETGEFRPGLRVTTPFLRAKKQETERAPSWVEEESLADLLALVDELAATAVARGKDIALLLDGRTVGRVGASGADAALARLLAEWRALVASHPSPSARAADELGEEALREKWRAVVQSVDPETAEHFGDGQIPSWLFHVFRPNGDGVEAIVAGMPGADEVLGRLRAVYAAAGAEGHGDLYFIPRKPPVATAEQLAGWTREHLGRMGRVAQELFQGDLAREPGFDVLIEGRFGVEVITGGEPPPRNRHQPHLLESTLYDITAELSHDTRSPHGELLSEPLYYIACDYGLATWIRWPEIREGYSVGEPLELWFELWRHGASLHFQPPGGGFSFDDDGLVRLWVERAKGEYRDAPLKMRRRRS